MIFRSLLAPLPVAWPVAWFLASLSGNLLGATQTAHLNVSASVVAQCTVAGGAGSGLPAAVLDFGSRDVLASGTARGQSPSSGTGALQVVCNSDTVTPTLALDAGAHPGGGSLRRLSGPGSVLVDYALYRDSARSQVVDTSAFALPRVTAGLPYVLVLYGSLPVPSQASVAGSYADVVNITLSY